MKLTRWMVAGVLLMGLLMLPSCFNTGEVKIGVIIPQEGSSLEEEGYQITSGIKLALDDLKKSGKLKKKYELIIKNEDRHDTQSVIRAFNELKDSGVTAIIGAASSASTLALAPLANESNIVLLSPASSSPEINEGEDSADNIFRNQPSDTLEAQALCNLIFQKCRMQKVLMVRSKTAYAEGITYSMLRFGRTARHEIPDEVVKFDVDTANVDFVAVVDRIVTHTPDAVFLGGYTDELIPLISEIKKREELKNTFVFTSSALLPNRVVSALGPENLALGPNGLEGVIYSTYHFEPQEGTPEEQAFARNFEENYHAKPDIYAANGYDAMIALAFAIDAADHWLHDAVRDELNKLVFDKETTFGLILRETDFNKRGDVTRIPQIYRIVDGKATKLHNEDITEIRNYILTKI